jgi:hypothetical protein
VKLLWLRLDLTGVFCISRSERLETERNAGMPKQAFTPEQIVAKRRQIEVLLSQRKTTALACKDAGITGI